MISRRRLRAGDFRLCLGRSNRGRAVQSVGVQKPIGAHAHRLIHRALPALEARQPDLNVRESMLHRPDHAQFVAEQRVQAEHQRRISQRLRGLCRHRGVGIVKFNAGVPQALERRGRFRAGGRTTHEQGSTGRTCDWNAHAEYSNSIIKAPLHIL